MILHQGILHCLVPLVGEGKETEVMQGMLKRKNVPMKGTFFCKGKFWFGNKDKPRAQDIADAKKFAKKMIK